MIDSVGCYEWIDWETGNQPGAVPIDNRGYMGIRKLDVAKHDNLMVDNAFII